MVIPKCKMVINFYIIRVPATHRPIRFGEEKSYLLILDHYSHV